MGNYERFHLDLYTRAGFCSEWMGWWPNKHRIRSQLPESPYITCKSGGYLPVSGGQLVLVMVKVTTTNTVGRTLHVQE